MPVVVGVFSMGQEGGYNETIQFEQSGVLLIVLVRT